MATEQTCCFDGTLEACLCTPCTVYLGSLCCWHWGKRVDALAICGVGRNCRAGWLLSLLRTNSSGRHRVLCEWREWWKLHIWFYGDPGGGQSSAIQPRSRRNTGERGQHAHHISVC